MCMLVFVVKWNSLNSTNSVNSMEFTENNPMCRVSGVQFRVWPVLTGKGCVFTSHVQVALWACGQPQAAGGFLAVSRAF